MKKNKSKAPLLPAGTVAQVLVLLDSEYPGDVEADVNIPAPVWAELVRRARQESP